MTFCEYCGTFILFGGKTKAGLRFCSKTCLTKGHYLTTGEEAPDGLVEEVVQRIHSLRCPRCEGRGPVDVHVSYRVWSLIGITKWYTRTALCCQLCGFKQKMMDLLYCLALGWWSPFWGLLITPLQVFRNIVSILDEPDHQQPSEKLYKYVRLRWAILEAGGELEDDLASEMLAESVLS